MLLLRRDAVHRLVPRHGGFLRDAGRVPGSGASRGGEPRAHRPHLP